MKAMSSDFSESLQVRRFHDDDAAEVSRLICRNFMEVNIKDYPREEMVRLADSYTAEKVSGIARFAHSYVIDLDGLIVGCGSIASYWGNEKESILLTIFVLPEYQGKGIGKMIITTLEQDDFFLRANRIEIPSSITACEFYLKLGYDYKNGVKALGEEGLYRLEKFR